MQMIEREDMNIVFVGHVDHGKSTIVGRMLADTNPYLMGNWNRLKKTVNGIQSPLNMPFCWMP